MRPRLAFFQNPIEVSKHEPNILPLTYSSKYPGCFYWIYYTLKTYVKGYERNDYCWLKLKFNLSPYSIMILCELNFINIPSLLNEFKFFLFEV